MSNIKGELELDFAGKKRKFKLDFLGFQEYKLIYLKPESDISFLSSGVIGKRLRLL